MSAELAAGYRQAAQVIRTGGLIKRAFEDGDGGHCTVGALIEVGAVQRNNAGMAPALVPLSELLGGPGALCRCGCGERSVQPFDHVTTWNDRAETTENDVITLLEQAAEKMEADL